MANKRPPERHRSERSEDGFALVLVTTLIVAVLATGMAAAGNAIGHIPLSRNDQDRQAALSAAEAGVQDYLNRLDTDPNYWEPTDPGAKSNVAMQTSPAWGWVPVQPGSRASYHYSVDISDMESYTETNVATKSWGTVYVTSTGKAGNETRTVQVGVRQSDFLNNLYFSVYNLLDPTLVTSDHNEQQWYDQNCVYYAYAQNTVTSGIGPSTQTQRITNDKGQKVKMSCAGLINYWITNNVADGRVQSNDEYYFCGTPTFDQDITTADPSPSDQPFWLDPAGCSGDNPSFLGPSGKIIQAASPPMPPSPQFIEAYASAQPDPSKGCLYYGPTSITFVGAQMQVYSPDTPASNTNCLGPSASTLLPLPANGVIYVANLPGSMSCTTDSPSWAENAGTGCMGNAFVTGQVDGQITVATDNNIYLVAPPSGSASATIGAQSLAGGDVLGLAANKDILINHQPGYSNVRFGPETWTGTIQNPTINAVLFSVNDTVGTTSFKNGIPLANLQINGAVFSKFMDIEGEVEGNSLIHGYNESYKWDSRLAHLTPPFFIPPNTTTAWNAVSFAELAPQNG